MVQPPRRFRFMWRDGVFVPENRLASYCDETFGEGEIVTFERHEDRSTASHNHYFASVQTAWENLPEGEERFPTANALRQWALIRGGYCTENTIVADSAEQAQLIASFMGSQEGTIIVVRDNIVKKYTAKSQSMKAMNKDEFQRSKVDVLDIIAELLEITRKRLEGNAGKAA